MPDNVLVLAAMLVATGFAVKKTWKWWFSTTPAFQAQVKGLMPNAKIMTPILGALALYLADLAFYVYGGKVFEVTYAKVPSIFWYGPLFLGLGIWAMGKANPTAVRLGGGLAVLIIALVLYSNVPWKMAWDGDGPKASGANTSIALSDKDWTVLLSSETASGGHLEWSPPTKCCAVYRVDLNGNTLSYQAESGSDKNPPKFVEAFGQKIETSPRVKLGGGDKIFVRTTTDGPKELLLKN